MKKYLCLVLILLAASPAAFAGVNGLARATSRLGKPIDVLPNQVIVKYRQGRSLNAKSKIFGIFKTNTLQSMGPLDMEVLRVPAGYSIDSFVKELQENPDVEFAEPNGLMHATFSPNDPAFTGNNQYYLGANYLNMPQAWDISQGSATTIVAVIDTGITASHPDLSPQLWAGVGQKMEIDWNGDGVINTTCTCSYSAACPAAEGPEQSQDSSPIDDNDVDCHGGGPNEYHGSRTSGLIAAATNNGTNMASVCPNCKIMAVKGLNANGTGPFSTIAAAIVWASTSGAKVINMSLGATTPDGSGAVQAAVNFALARNIVIVAASGNNGPSCTPNFPASIPGVIAVGSIGTTKNISNFSCRGNDIVAPGESILSTINSGTATGDGTSFATPLVSGVAALVRSVAPSMTYSDVASYLFTFASDLGTSGADSTYGYGMLNAYNTLVAVSSGAAIPSDRENPGQTYPKTNPYNPLTDGQLEIAIPSSFGTNEIEIKIKNLIGETVKTLSGTNRWDGKNEDGNYVASGLYFYFLKTSAGNATGKLTVLK